MRYRPASSSSSFASITALSTALLLLLARLLVFSPTVSLAFVAPSGLSTGAMLGEKTRAPTTPFLLQQRGIGIAIAPNRQGRRQREQHQQHQSPRGGGRGVEPLRAAPSAALALASSPAASIAILAGIILFHEAGHYLAARGFGIEVEEFSVGVGPKLFGFKAFGDEFNLRALPLGGYVRFPENYNTTLVQEMERKAFKAAEEFDKAQPAKSLREKIVNALTLGGVDDERRKQEKMRRAKVAEEFEKRAWWRRIGNAGGEKSRLPQSVEILDADDVDIEYYDDPNLLQNRPWQERAVVLSGGVAFNLILAYALCFGQINYGSGLPQPIFDQGAVVSSTPRVGAAAKGILEKGDIIVAVNGNPVTLSTSPSANEAQKGINDFISKIRATPDGDSLQLAVVHPGSARPVDVTIRPQRGSADALGNGPQSIGVLLSPNFVKSERVKSDSLVEGARLAADYVGRLTGDTAKGLVSLFAGLLMGKGSANQVSGPIGLIRTGSEVVSTKDWATIFLFAATISINLGVVNALPLPALDGGQLLFVLSEAVTGRKVDQRVQEGLTGAALFFLLLLSATAAFGDIEALFR